MKPRVFSFAAFSLCTARLKLGFILISMRLGLQVGLYPLSFGFSLISMRFSPFFVIWMAPRRETDTSRPQSKYPAKPSQLK